MTTPTDMNATATNATASKDFVDTLSDAHTWFMHFIETRQSIFIPCLVILGIALVAHVIIGWVLKRYAKRMNREGFQWTGVIASSLTAPAGLVIWVLALTMVARMLILPDPTDRESHILTERISQVRLGLVIALLAWFIVRTIRRFERKFASRARLSEQLDLTAVHAISNFLVVFVWLMAFLIAAQSYGMNMTAVLTLGGASAFALSFAFQDVFKNLFGGIMILLSRPFRVGDGITLHGKSISGEIEKIGIYQTRMRGWDKIPIILPNSLFLTNPILNLTGVTQRRIDFVIGLRYQDFDQVNPVVEDIESLLKEHDDTDENALLRVVFNNYGGSSLDISISCMTKPGASLGEAVALQQELMLQVGHIVSKHGADFAFPTQTLDLPGPIEVKSSSGS
ncbi:MAG: mechanosensitive ion channel family protein [Planctomycetota bacterium]|nr:mechanosensitive ion channel family protein [Planctomycetota bacterium]